MIRLTADCYRRLKLDHAGICTRCHQLNDDVMPHANNCRCFSCGLDEVSGVEHALLSGELHIVDVADANVQDHGPVSSLEVPAWRRT